METTTADQDPRASAKLHELVEDIAVAMLVTVTPDGALHSRPMLTQQMKEPGELWFMTSDETAAARDVADEQAVNVAYADPERQRYVSVSGQATVVRDRGKQEQFWRPEFSRYLPRGLDDPHLALLRVRIESADYWDVAGARMRALHPPSGDAGGTGAALDDAGDSERAAVEEDRDRAEHARVEIRATRATG